MEIWFLESSELVNEVVKGGDANLETFSLAGSLNDHASFACSFEWVSVEHLPMIKDTLREGTSGSSSSEGLGETEGLSDWQVGLDHDERSTLDWLFADNDTTTLGHALVNATYCIIWSLDFDQEDWLHETWVGSQLGSVQDTSGSWDDLTTTSVNSIGVKGNILEVESDTAHVLFSHHTFLGGPLECSLEGVLDFVQVLHLFGHIDQQVGA